MARSPRSPAEAYLLTDLRGADLRDPGGSIGRLRDVAVRVTTDGWPVVALRAGTRSGDIDVPWSAVRVHQPDCLDLDLGITADPPAGVIWLVGGVLDHELIDLDGKRVVRVGDVVLERRDGDLVAVGIEIGPAAIVRRLGLRRIARRLRRDLIDVTAVHLPGAAGEPLALETTHARLQSIETHELAALLERLPKPAAHEVLEELPPARAEHVFRHLRRHRPTHRFRRRVPRFRAP